MDSSAWKEIGECLGKRVLVIYEVAGGGHDTICAIVTKVTPDSVVVGKQEIRREDIRGFQRVIVH